MEIKGIHSLYLLMSRFQEIVKERTIQIGDTEVLIKPYTNSQDLSNNAAKGSNNKGNQGLRFWLKLPGKEQDNGRIAIDYTTEDEFI